MLIMYIALQYNQITLCVQPTFVSGLLLSLSLFKCYHTSKLTHKPAPRSWHVATCQWQESVVPSAVLAGVRWRSWAPKTNRHILHGKVAGPRRSISYNSGFVISESVIYKDVLLYIWNVLLIVICKQSTESTAILILQITNRFWFADFQSTCCKLDYCVNISVTFVLQHGPNRLPLYGLVAIAAVSLLFIFIGDINTLGPVVTIPFLLTYAAVDYAYFALAMSFDQRKKHTTNYLHDGIAADSVYGAVGHDDIYDGGLFGASMKSTSMYDGKVSETAKIVDDSMETSSFPMKSGHLVSLHFGHIVVLIVYIEANVN